MPDSLQKLSAWEKTQPLTDRSLHMFSSRRSAESSRTKEVS